eukprot:XP_022282413.1 zinc finger protein 606 isoform X3 [Canis lupus familiaris]
MVSERTTLEAFRPASRTQKTTRLRQVRIAKRSYSEPPFHRPHTEARGAATYSGLPKLGSGGGEGGVGPGQNCLARRGPGYYYTPWQDTDAAEANSRRTAPGTCHGGASGPAGSSPSRTTTPSNLRRASWSTSGERPPLSTAEVRRSLRLWGRCFCRCGEIGRTGNELEDATPAIRAAPGRIPRLPFPRRLRAPVSVGSPASGLAAALGRLGGPEEPWTSGLARGRGCRPRTLLSSPPRARILSAPRAKPWSGTKAGRPRPSEPELAKSPAERALAGTGSRVGGWEPRTSGCFSSARVHRRRGRKTWNVGGEQPPFPSACSDGGFC